MELESAEQTVGDMGLNVDPGLSYGFSACPK